MVAIENRTNSLEIIQKLIEIGANINERFTKNNSTALHTAVVAENRHVVALLLDDYNADTNLQDKKGLTAFDYAQRLGNRSILNIFSKNVGKSLVSGNGGSRLNNNTRPTSSRSRSSNYLKSDRSVRKSYIDDFNDF